MANRIQLIYIGVVVLTLSVGIGLGVIIGWFSHTQPSCLSPCDGVCLAGPSIPVKIIEDATPGVTEKIIERINAENIRRNLQNFTSYPHAAGTEGENVLADTIYNMWRDQGLDYVTRDTFDILLSYPNTSDPNYVYLFDGAGDVQYRTQTVEKIVRPEQNDSRVLPPFNAYSPSGNVTGPLVYVNYGRIEDFEHLTNMLKVNVTGCIVIARYGQIFRGDKVNIAADFGAIGVILYSDPADYSINDTLPVYPNSWWLPSTGVQRGTVLVGHIGDPLTPGYPSNEYAYRRQESEAGLPKIPVHPICAEDAEKFLSILGGDPAPAEWRGKLNITYNLGPGFNQATHSNWSVTLHVGTYNERRNTSSVIGFIYGSVEPDRYILLGNHRDAWVFGGVDPTSGTALMVEVSRVLMTIVKEVFLTDELTSSLREADGWRPRRTIVFCSWGTEEHGVLGSYEWVEKHVKNLLDRAVIYLNVDLAIEGWESMRAIGVPIVNDLLYDVAKKLRSANDNSLSVYEEWTRYKPHPKNNSIPNIKSLGSGSDYLAFIGVAGVPSLDVRYTHNFSIIDYPLYHSVYETFHLVDEHMDQGFVHSKVVGQFWAETARYVADSLLLPLSAPSYAVGLQQFIDDLIAGYGTLMRNNSVSLQTLVETANRFTNAANAFAARAESVNRNNPVEVRIYNDQLMRLERSFLDPLGLPPNRPYSKHVLYAPSSFDSYAGTTFPGLVDLMWKIDDLPEADKLKKWDEVRRHLATIIYTIDSAINVLQRVDYTN